MYFLLTLFSFAVVGSDALCEKYYPFRTQCSSGITLSQFGECVQKESKRPRSILPLEPLDPMPVDDIVVNVGSFVITNKNVVLKGLKDTAVEDVVWNINDYTGTVQLSGNSTLTSDYELDGNLFYLPVQSAGKFTVDIDNAKYQLKFQFKKVEDDSGVEHVQIYDITTVPILENLKFQITSSSAGGYLDNALNAALNNNWIALAPDAPAQAAASIAKSLQESINKIYYQIPFDDILQPVASLTH